MKKTALLISIALMLLLTISAISAVEIDNVTSTEGSNLIDDANELSSINAEDSTNQKTDLDNLQAENSDDSSDVVLKNTDSSVEKLTSNESSNVKVNTSISIANARYAQSATEFKVVLKDKDGKVLANQNVTLKISGKTYQGTTGSNGAVYIETAALKIGKYTATVSYGGDSQYNSVKVSTTVNVWSSIIKSSLTKVYGQTAYFTATFYQNRDPLANSNVKYTLNGKTYTVKTDANGAIKVDTSSLKPGSYTIKLYNPFSKETVSSTIKVKKDTPTLTGSNAYVLPKTKYTYTVTLSSKYVGPLKGGKITFKYNNKKVTSKTDANGKASVTISALSKGTYTITYTFGASTKYNSASGSSKLYVKDSTTTLKASALKMQYNDGSKFTVTATDSSKKALSNKNIKFTFNGKTTSVTTDSNGKAKLAIGNVKPGTYTIKYSYSTAGKKDYNIQSNSVVVTRQSVTTTASDLVMKHNDGSNFQVTIKNKTGTPLKDIVVQFTLGGKTTKVTTDSNGIAKLPITSGVGYYSITTKIVDTTYYTSSEVTKHILVNGTKFTASDVTLSANTAGKFTVKVLDGQSKPISTTIKFTLNNNVQSVQTDSNGVATLSISGLAKGTYTVTYTDGTVTGSSKITVVDKVTLKQVITASQNVKKYIENNGELPNTVTIGGVTYSTATYVYLASQAIINLKAGSKADIEIKPVSGPNSPKAAANLGNLYDYLSVAKSIVNTINSKGVMPDSVSSKVGTIGYKGLVYATARTVAFYGDNSIMPNYVTIKTYTITSSSSLNSKNTISNLKAYLAASTNCQVGNSKIKSLVNSLTSGLTSDLAKAKAIYNYVRDSISYSFYYNTKYGAVGTLNAKTGNCVDEAHLLVAMYRTAGFAARYVQGTCVFSSGNTYGHVWTQVLIGDTWIVCDPTSSRNSFGNVVNWNNNNYNLKGYYASIEF